MTAINRTRILRALAGVTACAVAVLVLFAIPATGVALTYREASGAAQLLGAAAGVSLVAAALLTTRAMIALLLFGLAASWFGQDLAALGDSGALLRSVATAAVPFAAVFALHLALSLPERRAPRAALAAAYAIPAVCAIGTIVTRDPLRDVYCWRQCSDNPLLVHAVPDVAHAFVVAGLMASAVIGAATVTVVAWRLGTATRVARTLFAPTLVATALFAIAEAARGVALVAVPLEDPGRTGFMAIYLVRATALVSIAAGITWTSLRARRARGRVRRLAGDLGLAPAPGSLRQALATALGDPTVDLLYWVPASGGFVDADGSPREPATGTQIMRAGRLLAIVVHEPTTLASGDLERLLGPAARLAIENEALRADVLSQLGQLRDSRARIVATADESRRRLERDLHDGAQQRLLAVGLELRLARAGAPGPLDERLGRVAAEVDRAFSELRELAHGIFPAVLSEAGLEAALPTLADRAPLVVHLGDITAERLPPPVEAGAYVTVDEAIRDAAMRHARAVDISAARRDGRLVVTASDDGTPRSASLVHIADRVGALGGTIELAPTLLRAEIPCA